MWIGNRVLLCISLRPLVFLPVLQFLFLLQHFHNISAVGFEPVLNDSTIFNKFHNKILDQELCGTVTAEYVGYANESEIDLNNREELLAAIPNDTRRLWIDSIISINLATQNDNCEYRVCGLSLPYVETIGSCRMHSSLKIPSKVYKQ